MRYRARPRPARARWVAVHGTSALLAPLALVTALTGCTGSSPGPVNTSAGSSAPAAAATTTAAPSTATVAGPSQAQADKVAVVATDPDPATAATVLVPSLADGVTKSGSHLLPAGTTLHLDTAAARTLEPGVVSVPATTTGTLAGNWDVTLVNANGAWLIASAVPA